MRKSFLFFFVPIWSDLTDENISKMEHLDFTFKKILFLFRNNDYVISKFPATFKKMVTVNDEVRVIWATWWLTDALWTFLSSSSFPFNSVKQCEKKMLQLRAQTHAYFLKIQKSKTYVEILKKIKICFSALRK